MKLLRILMFILFVCLTATAWSQPPAGKNGTFFTIDIAGAGETDPTGINNAGVITGVYWDTDDCQARSFIRGLDGTITPFDVPDAGTGCKHRTVATSINSAGAITGYYRNSNNVRRSFLRTPDGQFITFVVADAVPPSGTLALNINQVGEITGDYLGSDGLFHGFFRALDGTIMTFDPPGAVYGTYLGAGSCLNPAGTTVGYYYDADGTEQGFLRDKNGNITPFSVPGAAIPYGTGAWALNASGAASENWGDENGAGYGYVRSGNGRIMTFDPPGAGTEYGQGTNVASINAAGTTVGDVVYNDNSTHGFVCTKDFFCTIVDVPVANKGSWLNMNNSAGTTIGGYVDMDGYQRAFVWIPGGQLSQ